ncbi:G-type lectin S-receptor-like serine/threonine-protein kinase At1g11410 [Eucalyptus grandis]|uniref:G-type lectin S-receptor-like serine/threonine-protein kinase At1g11410 n=1 Tax=Eucalyptus grandis TaxID=71139 RepID=UPI00192F02DB|nr:G-type lectin S-receptor-like serine/threonine-protein kinase At1g11410 [Eucalyptus grandis]
MNAEKGLVYALLLLFLLQVSTCLDILNQNNTLKDGNLLVSSGKMFTLGFFSRGNSSHRYVGIWYSQISEQTIVWVANRERPISGTSGALSIDSDGNLVLYETNGSFPVWSTNVSSALSNHSTTAQLMDSGNLVLRDFSEKMIWQSFDYPTDTVLPLMKIGLNRKTGLNQFITSWKSPDDPTPGNYSLKIDATGYAQLFLYKDGNPYWRAGSWTGDRWSGIPEMTRAYLNLSFVNDPNEVSIMYDVIDASIITRMVVNESGSLRRSAWHDRDRRWIEFWFAPKDQCDYYGKCGPNSNCNPYITGQFECTCLPGLEPKSPGDWYLRDASAGCVRRGGVSVCRSGEGFVRVARAKVPDTSKARANMSLNLKECEEECLRDCSCTAYASASESLGGSGCLIWHGDLVDTKTFADSGQDLYVRVDAIELARHRKTRSLSQKAMVAIILVSILTALLLAGFFLYGLAIKKRRDRRSHNPQVSDMTSSTYFNGPQCVKDRSDEPRGNRDVPLFDLSTVASATNNFSVLNKLGRGGFGSVYKGVMDNGMEIAVKRLSKHSGQGVKEFKNEVRLIAKLQHRNLVRILGCCVEEDEKMLIYEYLPNKSLDTFLFDRPMTTNNDWRKRFEIASGVARGLLYLHQDSRLRIIHRDLKASNILLDAAMNPKISDFGMARVCGGDQIQGNTNRVVGTYGYMAPEYAMQGQFSIKSDVYSYGVLLLEIITGQRNSGCYHMNPFCYLIGHVWELWKGGKCMDIVDKSIGNTYSEEIVSRCIQIGLLCVQRYASDRPTMSTVVFMLGNADVVLPFPKQPAFIDESDYNGNIQLTCNETCSVNRVTITAVEAC